MIESQNGKIRDSSFKPKLLIPGPYIPCILRSIRVNNSSSRNSFLIEVHSGILFELLHIFLLPLHVKIVQHKNPGLQLFILRTLWAIPSLSSDLQY